MKKTIALALCLLMVVSLAACGGQAAAEESSANTEQTETAEPAAEETTQPEESSEPVEAEPAETGPAFDTSWAGADYIMPIPEPPFAYEVNVDGTAVEIRSTNGGMNGDVTHQSILDYCEELKNAGFTSNLTENEIGERYGRTCYEFSASDAAGNNVNLIDDGGGVIIFASLKKTSGETNAEENGSIDVSSLGIPELPEGNWEKEQFNDNTYIMTIEDIDYADIDKYIEALSSENFTIFEIEPYSGTYCEYQAEKNVGRSGLIISIQYGNDGTDCRVAITKKQYQ